MAMNISALVAAEVRRVMAAEIAVLVQVEVRRVMETVLPAHGQPTFCPSVSS